VLHEAVPDDQTQGDRGPAFRGIRYAFTQFQKAAEIRHDGHRIVFSSLQSHATFVDEFGRSCYPVTSSRIREIGPSFTQAVTPHGTGEVLVAQPHRPSFRKLLDQ